ncbi:MAG: outer membrane beta-barrel protein, partial [Pseudomonadota bacterium]
MFVSTLNRIAGASGLAALLLLSSAGAQAQSDDALIERGQWWISPLGNFIVPDEERVGDSGFGGQIGVGKLFSDHVGLELNAGGGRIDGFNETGQVAVNLDLLAIGDLEKSIAPYGLFGVGLLNSNVAEDPSQRFVEDTDNVTLSVGAG